MKSRHERIIGCLSLKVGKTRSMEELLETLAESYEEKEKKQPGNKYYY
ncbi:MAG TPA: hypothetical protein VH500_20455 [Nitrososphaeraceae archaeon]|jgi:hypothetical protein